jgi:acetyl esterase/lipase
VRIRFFAILLFVAGAFLPLANHLSLRAAEPAADAGRGQRMVESYFRHQVEHIASACLTDIKTKEDWEKKRPELRRQFLEMIGLWPMPPRTDLRPVVTGKVETEHFTVEKLHFQSSPGLYVTANLYIPKKAAIPAPAVLYVCGHANTVVDKVSYGSKVSYQHHAAWFAEHGYVCLILDTLQLGEIPGIHHGTHNQKMWWWQTLGYTPAGIECWNAIRALDYLETRKEVDPKRIGVTGRSGGGATSWWLAAADDRPQCMVPVAGIADLQAHLVEGSVPQFRYGVISGHCDCMYFVNTYRWDFPLVAALCAPRPLMLGNSNADTIFPVPGYRRVADKVRRLYELYGAADRFVVMETAGPHKDTADLRLGAYRWMNFWLKGGNGDTSEPDRPRLTPAQLKVLDHIPDGAANAMVQETFILPATWELPRVPAVAREWWSGQQQTWLQQLKDKVFRGWPENPPQLNPRQVADIRHDGVRLRAFDFTSEEDVELRLWLVTADKVDKPTLVIASALDEPGWKEWLTELGPAFQPALQRKEPTKLDEAKFTQNRRSLEFHRWAFAMIAPRGIGPTAWLPSPLGAEPPVTGKGGPDAGKSAEAYDTHLRRRFALIGQTLDGQRVWDLRRGLAALRDITELKGIPLWLQGDRDMAGIVLYAAIFEPEVARLDLWHLPASHREGPIFLNVRRFFDMPQAIALAFPRPIRLYTAEETGMETWKWPLQLQATLGEEFLKIRKVGE